MPLGAFRLNTLAKTQAVAAGPRTAATATVYNDFQVTTSSPKYGSGAGTTTNTATSGLLIDLQGGADLDDFFDNTKSITFETWFKIAVITYQLPSVISHYTNTGAGYPANAGWGIRTRFDRSVPAQRIPELFYITSTGSVSSAVLTGWGVPTANTWYHVAFENYNGRQNIWVDGTNVMSRATPTSYRGQTDYDLYLGDYWPGRNYSTETDHFDDLRISSPARYQVDGTSITIPSAELSNDSDTKALFHFNGTNGSTTFTDDVS